jgi:hypothetical protein
MKATDYPIEHFELMTYAATLLRSIGAQMTTSEYHYQTFGSWSFVFRKNGNDYRVLYDGKESQLQFESDPARMKRFGVFITEWKEVVVTPVDLLRGQALQPKIEELIKEGLIKVGAT